MKTAKAGISLGSNLGDRLENLRGAYSELIALNTKGETAATATAPLVSKIYETEPVDCAPETASYLNAVIEINFTGEPHSLLAKLRAIENQFGRPRQRPRNSPRTLDLDILYFGELSLTTNDLVIPHPRLAQRRFVLAPLCDIRHDLILPGQQKNVRSLLANLPPQPAVTLFKKPLTP